VLLDQAITSTQLAKPGPSLVTHNRRLTLEVLAPAKATALLMAGPEGLTWLVRMEFPQPED